MYRQRYCLDAASWLICMELLQQLDRLHDGDTLVLAGSIPADVPDDIYERILQRLEGRSIKTVVDATGDLLLNVLKYKPFLIKPNKDELGDLFDIDVCSRDEIVEYGQRLQEMGARNVLVSLGGDGAILIAEDGHADRKREMCICRHCHWTAGSVPPQYHIDGIPSCGRCRS